MRAVVDTNVLVSGLINANGFPGRIVDLLRAGSLEIAVDDRILAEYRDVLRRDFFRTYFSERDSEDTIDFLEKNSFRISSPIALLDMPDPGDAPFLEIALAANAPLVTGNKRHYPEDRRGNCRVLDPGEFLRAFFASSAPERKDRARQGRKK
jgi:putative PIN family toxin of toxin-antitoxin system